VVEVAAVEPEVAAVELEVAAVELAVLAVLAELQVALSHQLKDKYIKDRTQSWLALNL
jgi:hypothetical protein